MNKKVIRNFIFKNQNIYKFWKELNECYPDILKFQITELKPNDIQYLINNETNLNFCFKTICFLFQIYKRIFERLIALNNQIVQGILQNKIDSNKSFKIIDGIKITLNSLIEFLLNNIFGTLSQIKPEFLNLSHFRQMNSIFDLIYKWFNKENLKILMSSVKDFIAPDASNYYLESVNSFDQAFDHIPKFKIEREKSKFTFFY